MQLQQGAADDLPPGHSSPLSVFRKVYVRVLPLLCLVAALCYIDRTNLAYASFSMTRDLQFSPSVYGTGAWRPASGGRRNSHLSPFFYTGSGLFFAGYSLAMIPSQLIGLRVGMSRW